MKLLKSKEVSKKIIISIILVISFNFAAPTITNADFGGALFKPISLLLVGISDLIIEGLQKTFVGYGTIKYGGIDEIESDTYNIRYSPGVIFSGGVPALDVNFINPNFQGDEKFKVQKSTGQWSVIGEFSGINDEGLKKYGLTDVSEVQYEHIVTDDEWYMSAITIQPKGHMVFSWREPVKDADGNIENYNEYKLISTMVYTGGTVSSGIGSLSKLVQEIVYGIDNIFRKGLYII